MRNRIWIKVVLEPNLRKYLRIYTRQTCKGTLQVQRRIADTKEYCSCKGYFKCKAVLYSPGLWPRRMLDHQLLIFGCLVDSPLPLSRQLGPGKSLPGLAPSESRDLMTAFVPFLIAYRDLSRHHAILSSIFVWKNAKIEDFGFPKTFQNTTQSDLNLISKKHVDLFHFLIDAFV